MMKPSKSSLINAIQQHAKDVLPYYQQWLFDEPLLVSQQRFRDTEYLQQIMHKLIIQFVNHYETFSHLMPLSDDVKSIIDIWSTTEYEIGTYRTDFVFDAQLQFRPIEITCRFALNGYFITGILNKHVEAFPHHTNASDFIHPYADFLTYFLNRLNGHNKVILLRDSENKNESSIFTPILNFAGITVESYSVEEINLCNGSFDDYLIINELTFNELTQLSLSAHQNLAQSNFMNDLRTVFLVHDKRFFSVILDPDLQAMALSDEEISWCKEIFIPCYAFGQNDAAWKAAQKNKNNWILKHRALGKSKAVYAGPVTSEAQWQALFESDDISEFIIQQWIEQPRFTANIADEILEDYFTGTLLYLNEQSFGFAEFRTSSFPVTNQVDHRKCMGLILKEDSLSNALAANPRSIFIK